MKIFFKYCYGLLRVIFCVGFGISLAGCDKNIDANSNEGSEILLSTDADSSFSISKKIGQSCSTQTFQGSSTQEKPVDVLFVVETSPSMVDIRPKVLQGINGFIAGLPLNSDFNIAVMLSHGSTSHLSGKLYKTAMEPLVLQSSQLTNEQIQTYLTAKLAGMPFDADSGGGEEGMFSLFRGITTPSLLEESRAASFFRADAALSVVVIADRRDICASVPEGVPAETDPVKIDARVRDCEGLTAAGLVNRLTLLKGSQPLHITGIIYTDAPAPEGKEISYGYTDLISLKSGVAIDIARDDISAGMAPIIALGGQSSQKVFTLTQADADPSTIKVTVNGQEAPFTFDGTKVTLTGAISTGATIVITACSKGENPYVGNCRVFEKADQWDHWTPIASTQDLELKDKSGNFSVGAVRNLVIKNVSGALKVQSAINIPSISFLSGNSYIRLAGDITTISDSASVRIDKAGNVGTVLNTRGGIQLNALTIGSYIKAAGNSCIRARSIGKVQSMNGTKTIIANEINELSAVTGVVHVYGAVIKSVIDTGGRVCLHNGAKVVNSSNVSGVFAKCEQ
ncbi:MAG TPA: hypothetical protein VIG33_04010 [Pseudobdellovibrionaceae bacterium]|jgi:hypothetical protein